MEFANTCLGALCACMQDAVVKEKVRAVVCPKGFVDDAQTALQDLKDNYVLRDHESVANTHGMQLTAQVQRWHEKVQLHEKERTMTQIKDDYNKRGCFLGSCSLNCWANYKISQRSKKLLTEIMTLKTEHEAFKETIEKQPLRAITEIPTSTIVVGNIIKLNLGKIHDYLADDNVSMVGIWGMGGVGKTTLLNEINNSLQGGDTTYNMGFKYVIYLVVSKEPQFEQLQKDISKKLGLPSDSEKDDIFDFLKNKDFLLLLDDMWKAVDLPETLGIPLARHQIGKNWEDGRGPRYKHTVIFTTREDDVCAHMKADKKIKVECLNGEEAWHLFKQHANEEAINSNAIIKKLAMEVMEKCSGLPLALKVIGRATSNKKTPEEWQHMLRSLVKLDVKAITGVEETLFSTLKLSYDHLIDDTLRECFLCCAQWPEDRPIPMSDLIEYWIEFGLIDDFDNIGEAFNKGYSLIGMLNDACLLELETGSYGEHYVKLHDVIRDMALWIVSECGKKKNKWIVVASDDDLRQFSNCEAGNWMETQVISLKSQTVNKRSLLKLLSDQNIDEKDEASVFAATSPRHPNLKYLFIEETHFVDPTGGLVINFFPHMPSLIHLNLSGTSITGLSKEIQVLVNLRYLNISYTNIKSLPPELEELKELKYFICRGVLKYKIEDGLPAISKLPKLQVLDLYRTTCLEADDLSLLKRRLKGIGMHVKSSVKILGLLKDLPTWNISLESIQNMRTLQLCDLSCKHNGEGLMKIWIHDCDFEELVINGSAVSLKRFGLISLSKLKQITWPAETVVPTRCFQSLTCICISDCGFLRSLSWVLHLPCLVTLTVQSCSAMDELFHPADEMQQANSSGLTTFPSLQILDLWNMPNLMSLSTCPLDFPVLSALFVGKCPKLKKLTFKSSIVNNKFSFVDADKESWEGLEWEDTTIPSHLTKFLSIRDPS